MARGRVLIIEDDVDVATTTIEILTDRGYEVKAVTTAEEGLATIPAFQPDVLLLDMSLPGLSGPRLVGMFRHANPKLPIIVVTSMVDREIIGQITDMKPFQFVHKPYDPDVLHGLITAAIERGR